MDIRQKIKEGYVFFDGATGTMLSQMASLAPGQAPETLNLQEPQAVTALHRMYIEAGANVLKTNTFGANRLKHKDPDAIIAAAFACAKEAKGEKDVCIALDIGPLGKLLKPLGTLDFEEAISVFADMVRSGVKYGADAILIETMIDTYELKAALLAAKEHSDLPVFVSCTVGADGKLMTGADPEAVVALVEGLGADAVGVNCSAGPESLRETVKRFYEAASIPVIANPNANLPRIEDGKPVYDTTDKEFAESACLLAKNGARMLGGCCGTTPAMIAALKAALQNETPLPLVQRKRTVISSHTHAYLFESSATLIGECINAADKEELKEALLAHDMADLEDMALDQKDEGAAVLNVNVSIAGIDEAETLPEAVCAIQAVCDLPLQIDVTNPMALEKAIRVYNGKPLINLTNETTSAAESVFSIAKKYGGVVMASSLNEAGAPATAEGRAAIAERIVKQAEQYGLCAHDVLFDPFAISDVADVAHDIERLLEEKGYKCLKRGI